MIREKGNRFPLKKESVNLSILREYKLFLHPDMPHQTFLHGDLHSQAKLRSVMHKQTDIYCSIVRGTKAGTNLQR